MDPDPERVFHDEWTCLVDEIKKIAKSITSVAPKDHRRISEYKSQKVPSEASLVRILLVLERQVGHLLGEGLLDRDRWCELRSQAAAARDAHNRPGAARPAPAFDEASYRLLRNTVGDDGDVFTLTAGADQSFRLGVSTGVETAYIPRAGDWQVRSAIDLARTAGGLIIIRGESGSGLTRAAHEAAKDRLKGYLIVVPAVDSRDAIARLSAACRTLPGFVLWLDRLERYLPRPDGGCTGLHQSLQWLIDPPHSSIILATISSQAAAIVEAEGELYAESRRIISELGTTVLFEPPSHDSARKFAHGDRRLTRALNDVWIEPSPRLRRIGLLPQKLATLIEWERAFGNRRGLSRTLLDALVDLSSLGWVGAVPESLLRSACRCDGRNHTDGEWVTAVTEVCGNEQRLVRNVSGGYVIEDYVLEHAFTQGSGLRAHPTIWDAVVAEAHILTPSTWFPWPVPHSIVFCSYTPWNSTASPHRRCRPCGNGSRRFCVVPGGTTSCGDVSTPVTDTHWSGGRPSWRKVVTGTARDGYLRSAVLPHREWMPCSRRSG